MFWSQFIFHGNLHPSVTMSRMTCFILHNCYHIHYTKMGWIWYNEETGRKRRTKSERLYWRETRKIDTQRG